MRASLAFLHRAPVSHPPDFILLGSEWGVGALTGSPMWPDRTEEGQRPVRVVALIKFCTGTELVDQTGL